ncbi:MAG: 2-hydroxyhepta-2,4-diene,7-dioate isomerase [Microbacteriaceae bacterium]|nr:2-hydroxyhepta-2,4-diene,7-dioate isomerase [Microbacteriaceae bacterium]
MMTSTRWPGNARTLGDGPVALQLVTPNGGKAILRPGKVICVGHNYASHIAEMGREAPRYPNLFAKFPQTLTTAQDVMIDYDVDADWEAELVAVIGRPIYRASREEAALAIGGYTIGNDVSMRDRQSRTSQWLAGKAYDAATPIGPIFVSAEEWRSADAELRCRVNGKTEQWARISDLIFSAADLVFAISEFAALNPGDLIFTGTPGGVGASMSPPRFLTDGDVVECEIDGIGTLTTRFVVQTSLGRKAE